MVGRGVVEGQRKLTRVGGLLGRRHWGGEGRLVPTWSYSFLSLNPSVSSWAFTKFSGAISGDNR